MWLLSLNHCVMSSFVCTPPVMQISADTSQVWTNKCVVVMAYDRSISQSTAFEGCQSLCKCLEWMWEPFHVGLEPRPLTVASFGGWLPKSGPTSVVIMARWRIHTPIRSIWRLSITFYVFELIWEPSHVGVEPQPLCHIIICVHTTSDTDLSLLHKSGLTSVVVMAWWWIHTPIHSI